MVAQGLHHHALIVTLDVNLMQMRQTEFQEVLVADRLHGCVCCPHLETDVVAAVLILHWLRNALGQLLLLLLPLLQLLSLVLSQ